MIGYVNVQLSRQHMTLNFLGLVSLSPSFTYYIHNSSFLYLVIIFQEFVLILIAIKNETLKKIDIKNLVNDCI